MPNLTHQNHSKHVMVDVQESIWTQTQPHHNQYCGLSFLPNGENVVKTVRDHIDKCLHSDQVPSGTTCWQNSSCTHPLGDDVLIVHRSPRVRMQKLTVVSTEEISVAGMVANRLTTSSLQRDNLSSILASLFRAGGRCAAQRSCPKSGALASSLRSFAWAAFLQLIRPLLQLTLLHLAEAAKSTRHVASEPLLELLCRSLSETWLSSAVVPRFLLVSVALFLLRTCSPEI